MVRGLLGAPPIVVMPIQDIANEVASTAEPLSLVLLGIGMAGLAAAEMFRRRRANNHLKAKSPPRP